MIDVAGSISIIKNFMGNAGRNTCNEYLYDALKDAVECMEKEIPKKPIRKSWELTRCPCCGHALGEWIGDGYTKDWITKERCRCGQLLDWDD